MVAGAVVAVIVHDAASLKVRVDHHGAEELEVTPAQVRRQIGREAVGGRDATLGVSGVEDGLAAAESPDVRGTRTRTAAGRRGLGFPIPRRGRRGRAAAVRQCTSSRYAQTMRPGLRGAPAGSGSAA